MTCDVSPALLTAQTQMRVDQSHWMMTVSSLALKLSLWMLYKLQQQGF